MADEIQREKWREARKRYTEKNRDIILARDRESKRKKYAEDPEWREELKFKKRANGLGITREKWDKMFDDQDRRCAICKLDDPGSSKGWNLDHCHKTKTIRFILCIRCNMGLGQFRDDPKLLRMAADMLEKFNKDNLMDTEPASLPTPGIDLLDQ